MMEYNIININLNIVHSSFITNHPKQNRTSYCAAVQFKIRTIDWSIA